MNVAERYASAKEMYAKIGVDTDAALAKLQGVPVSMHCWQGDDVIGFDGVDSLSGGIQATGNYPGKARNPQELLADIDKALSLIPGKHRLNIHASYAIFEEGEWVDRDKLEPKHFAKWVEFAKERGLGLDFNPTIFSHAKAERFTLSSPDPEIRKFWIDHCKACIRISEYFAEELGTPCMMNIWIPDGYKDIPANRLVARQRLKEALDEIISMDYDKSKVLVAVESKVFGIGMEACTVGSHEFYMNYAAKNDLLCLLDAGHYHPTEMISDKLSAMLPFYEKIALHVSRPMRWDSDHVIMFNDEVQEIAKEIVVHNATDRVLIGLDYFDATINRIAAWVIGMRNMQKALLLAMLRPDEMLTKAQDEENYTDVLAWQEVLKEYPFGDVWDYFCEKNHVPLKAEWLPEVRKYEEEVLLKRV